jgi:hypothetical protein
MGLGTSCNTPFPALAFQKGPSKQDSLCGPSVANLGWPVTHASKWNATEGSCTRLGCALYDGQLRPSLFSSMHFWES